MHIVVDDKGFTRDMPGPPNVYACLKIDSDPFFQLFMQRLLNQRLSGTCKTDPVAAGTGSGAAAV